MVMDEGNKGASLSQEEDYNLPARLYGATVFAGVVYNTLLAKNHPSIWIVLPSGLSVGRKTEEVIGEGAANYLCDSDRDLLIAFKKLTSYYWQLEIVVGPVT